MNRSRRRFMGLAVGAAFLPSVVSVFGSEDRKPWKIGITDWDLRSMGNPNAFAVAKELGFEGVQVSYQPSGEFSLSKKENRTRFLDTAKESGLEIASLAMGFLNGQPLATTDEAEAWVADDIDAMTDMNVDQTLLAFFGNGDMNAKKDHQPLVVEKLKRLAKKAEAAKKILAVESYLSAEDSLRILDAVQSDFVKIYYDVRNSSDRGYDIFKEMKFLGEKKLISQIHLKENSCRLGAGTIDFVKVRRSLEEIGYSQWLVVESAVSGDWKESQAANADFVKKTF